MRQYLIDEVSGDDIQRICRYLDEHVERSSIENLYWLNLDSAILTDIQAAHGPCQPYCVAIEVGDRFVRFELLVRSRVRHNCGCTRYADSVQRDFVIDFAERMIRRLEIRT